MTKDKMVILKELKEWAQLAKKEAVEAEKIAETMRTEAFFRGKAISLIDLIDKIERLELEDDFEKNYNPETQRAMREKGKNENG